MDITSTIIKINVIKIILYMCELTKNVIDN